MKKRIYGLIIIMILTKSVFAAHYIVGGVEDSVGGENPNGKTITLWNPANGRLENVTDIIGPLGKSGVSRLYMIDCEQLATPCTVGDTMSIQVLTGGFITNQTNITVTGAGFDLASNITLNSPVTFGTVNLDDDLTVPANEIDLLAALTKTVTCSSILTDADGEDEILEVTGEFFDNTASFPGDTNDNNTHYTNSSCILDKTYGDGTEVNVTCTFEVEYYANPGLWNCTLNSIDLYSINKTASETTTINELLAIGVDSPIQFGKTNATEVSGEVKVNVTNYGNIEINLSLSGYAQNEGDGYAMNCSSNSINITHQKYNLTTPTPGDLDYTQFSQSYQNLTSTARVNEFSLSARQNDAENEAIKPTYWRIYVPESVGGTCTGNTFFGAAKAPADP